MHIKPFPTPLFCPTWRFKKCSAFGVREPWWTNANFWRQNGFVGGQATNQSFCQRTQLNERHDPTLHSLKRYATLSFHPPHFSTERKGYKNDGDDSAGNLRTICQQSNFFLDRAPACPWKLLKLTQRCWVRGIFIWGRATLRGD